MSSEQGVNHVSGMDQGKVARPTGWAFGMSCIRGNFVQRSLHRCRPKTWFEASDAIGVFLI